MFTDNKGFRNYIIDFVDEDELLSIYSCIWEGSDTTFVEGKGFYNSGCIYKRRYDNGVTASGIEIDKVGRWVYVSIEDYGKYSIVTGIEDGVRRIVEELLQG